ncbi:MAG: hypothetical protein C4345_02685, partial [Chloroflexota bacterium]
MAEHHGEPGSQSHEHAGEKGAVARATGPLVSLQEIIVVYQVRKGLFRTDEVHALNGVSLDVARGET